MASYITISTSGPTPSAPTSPNKAKSQMTNERAKAIVKRANEKMAIAREHFRDCQIMIKRSENARDEAIEAKDIAENKFAKLKLVHNREKSTIKDLTTKYDKEHAKVVYLELKQTQLQQELNALLAARVSSLADGGHKRYYLSDF
jgi:hypothetical protein